ncbi:MAG: c-type cytochrome [Planctomycetota bacterium]
MSNQSLLLLLLIAWAAGTLVLGRALQHDSSERRPEFLMDMAHSPGYEAQGANSLFKDDRNLLMPVEGTIARGFLPFAYEATPEGAALAGRELKNPLSASPQVLARGQVVFGNFCAACHGAGGLGDGIVTKRGVPPPPSLLAENAKKMADGEIYHAITLGKINMPAHAAQVRREDRWKVISYIREMQGSGK